MDLFAAAGVDLPRSGTSARKSIAPRSLRTPLFAYKVVEDAIRLCAPLDDSIVKVASDYARKVRGLKAAKEKTFSPVFIDEILIKVLGYSRIDPDKPYTLADQQTLGTGAVDTALGHFRLGEAAKVLAPFELKGPDTKDLDRIMSGRGKTPVQQAWEYANDAPGAKWVLVSNCVEIRLYDYGRGREAYEVFDGSRLDDLDELRRLWLILGALNLLGDATERLLRETDAAYADVTDRLYRDYRDLRERLLAYLVDSGDGPKLSLADAIQPAQKILDRVLFIAFAQRRDLMRGDLLESALKANNEWHPQPVWSNFLGLFRYVDKGNFDMDIPPYNGGLFAEDPLVDKIILTEDLAKDVASLGAWDYRREVPVTVLGHIFEQSITDIEKKKAEARGEEPPMVSARKRTGVVYTPDMVTRFLVEQTIGKTLDERRADLRAAHGVGEGDIPADKEIAFWQAWLDVLRNLTIVDPACGSGAFLVAAFDRLALEYRPVLEHLDELGAPAGLDAFDEIVTRNLYGVDLNLESVEITRLSLWLKTARRDHRLQSLETTVRVGDSLIEDGAFTARPFDWRSAFPRVFERGGFDVVIGNPPYVRMELIRSSKPYLDRTYEVAARSADLYAYFYERGIGLLKEGGRLGFISSSTFFRTGSGGNLRKFLSERTAVETMVDFGDAQLFEGVTTYPAIVTLAKSGAVGGDLAYLVVEGDPPADLGRAFGEGARTMPRVRLSAGPWHLDDDAHARLRDKISLGRKTLGEIYGAPIRGILTGLNEAFIIDRVTRELIVGSDPDATELIQPFLRGENIQRWHIEDDDLWLINVEFGFTRKSFGEAVGEQEKLPQAVAWNLFSTRYPALAGHLNQFAEKARRRLDKGQYWWELRACTYNEQFSGDKVLCPDLSQGPKFCIERGGAMPDCTVFVIPKFDDSLLSILNAKASWYFLFNVSNPLRGGKWRLRMKSQYVSRLPIPEVPDQARLRLAALAGTCTDAGNERFAIQSAVRRRILDLAPPERRKLTHKLNDWHALDFAAFRAEVKHAFHHEIPVRERGEWEAYLGENAAKVRAFSEAIAAAEREIDRIVYGLFELTTEEIGLLEFESFGSILTYALKAVLHLAYQVTNTSNRLCRISTSVMHLPGPLASLRPADPPLRRPATL